MDKPAGLTSHDVVARIRRLLHGAKVGHAGTLDPQATGVLVLCVGAATKISSFLMEGEKEYAGTARLGIETDSQDAAGAVVAENPVTCGAADVRAAASRWVGEIEQVPPMFSAVKVGGRKLYQLARKGVEVERAARPVTIHALDVVDVTLPEFRFRVRCSKGTYVRTLIHDIGRELGCGAHLASLQRTRQGGFHLDDVLPWDALEGPDVSQTVLRDGLPPEEALAFLPELALPADAPPLRVGALLALPEADASAPAHGVVRLRVAGGGIAGLAKVDAEGIRILHLLAPGARGGRRWGR